MSEEQPVWQHADTAHVRFVRMIPGRRGYGHAHRRFINKTLCGAPMTEWDFTVPSAKKKTAEELARWTLCRACQAAVANLRGKP